MSTPTITRNKAGASKMHKPEGVVAKRKVTPHDSEESDPDFINGASFVVETKKRKAQRIPAKPSKRFKKLKVGSSTFLVGENPLKKWLGSDLDVKSASETDDDEHINSENDDEDVSYFRFRRQSRSSSREPVGKKGSFGVNIRARVSQDKSDHKSVAVHESMTETEEPFTKRRPPPPRREGRLIKPSPATGDESMTEPDTDEDVPAVNHKRKVTSSRSARPAKKAKLVPKNTACVADESVTESDSATEPESDDLTPMNSLQSIEGIMINRDAPPSPVKQSRHPRPDFKKSTSKKPTNPLVLDKSRGVQVTPSINRWLRDYQREGVEFFYERYKEGRGGILGDDMGLGKTIQVIAFLSAIMKKIGDSRDQNRRQEHVDTLQNSDEWHTKRKLPPANATWPTCLIIAPATVVHNWEREFETWGYFEVGLYTGTPDERTHVLRDFELGRLDIVVTSFELALRDIEHLETQHWSCVFVDEAHRIKNSKSQTTIALNRFTCEVRCGLTGTAIQNNYTELWTILDWSNPGRLGTSSQWNGWVTKPLARGQENKAPDEVVATGRIVAERLVTRLLPNFFKRRTKDIIADQLPKKIDQVVFCPLTDIQKAVYKRFLETVPVQTMLKKDDPCDCGSGRLGKDCHYNKWESGWMFQNITTLIKISNHLALILPAPIDTPEQTLRHRDQANIGWPPVDGVQTAPRYGEAVFDPRLCGKWKVLKDLLATWHKEGDNKVLIFTKSVKLIEMLEQRLKETFMEFRKLDGSVKQKDRMALIDEFNDDPKVFVFLISTLAGGVGLNLTGANKVVIFDPNWNPAHDLQAMDRAYRFGQLRDVSVYRLLGAGSLEELIYKRQIYKQQQMKIGYEASHQTRYFEGVQGDKSKQGDLFGLKNIFRLDESGTNTKHTIERSHLAQLDWALAHLDGKSKRKGVPEEGIAIDEFNDKVEETNVKGLGALFFGTGDEDLPQKPDAENEILRILNSNGVSYTHHNESLLKPSNIETRLTSKAIEGKKKRAEVVKKKSKGVPDKPEIPWPPRRRHHKSHAPRKAGLSERRDALITLGYITTPADFPKFAEEFLKKPEEEQADILGELDEETAMLENEGLLD